MLRSIVTGVRLAGASLNAAVQCGGVNSWIISGRKHIPVVTPGIWLQFV